MKTLLMWQTYYSLTPDELMGREPVPEWKRLKMIGQMHVAAANAEKRDSKGNRIVKRKK